VADAKTPKQPRIIAVANQKGGVGKTTTTINLGASLSGLGFRVLAVDLDPQGNASTGLGVSVDDRDVSSYDFMVDGAGAEEAVQETDIDGLYIIPATGDLSSADMDLVENQKRSQLLSLALSQTDVRDLAFDFVLIDCPPSLSLLTVNALVAAHSVLVPLQSEFFALEGLSQLMLTIREVRQTANPDIRIEGIVMTMYDGRNNLSQQVERDARENLGDLVFQTVIPRNVRVSEAPSFAMPVVQYDPASKGSVAYQALARELVDRYSYAAA